MFPWITAAIKTCGLEKEVVFEKNVRVLSKKDPDRRDVLITRRRDDSPRVSTPLLGTDSRVAVILRFDANLLKKKRDEEFDFPDLENENMWSIEKCRFVVEEMPPGPRPTVVLVVEQFRFVCRLENAWNIGIGFKSRLTDVEKIVAKVADGEKGKQVTVDILPPESLPSSVDSSNGALSQLIKLMTLDPEKEKIPPEEEEETVYMRSVKCQTSSKYTFWKSRRTLEREESESLAEFEAKLRPLERPVLIKLKAVIDKVLLEEES